MVVVGDRGGFAPERPKNQSSDCSGAWKPAAQEHPECSGHDYDDDELIMVSSLSSWHCHGRVVVMVMKYHFTSLGSLPGSTGSYVAGDHFYYRHHHHH